MLEDSNIPNPYNEALLLFSYCAEINKEEIIKNINNKVSNIYQDNFFALVKKRSEYVPIAYILGYKEFWSLAFKVSQDTLIPRPDSEVLVEEVIKKCRDCENINILDLGTGSGALLLSILHEIKSAKGTGIDISKGAINIAIENAKLLSLANRTRFINDSWNNLEQGKYDIIISNPPYIAKRDISFLQNEVQNEPMIALDGGEDGLDCYKEIINIVPRLANKNCLCFFEIGYNQDQAICDLLQKSNFNVIQVVPDLSGISRVVIFQDNKLC